MDEKFPGIRTYAIIWHTPDIIIFAEVIKNAITKNERFQRPASGV
jgi:hypothetical protein